ncbi:MAG: MBL fold metallo-hydrolase [Pseudomonadales bacterium]|nr:MBL fold metallo-hydrolase [Pseudomonadales bacterium]
MQRSFHYPEQIPVGEPIQLAQHLYMLRMPMDFHPGHINCYLLEDVDGFVVFDAGPLSDACDVAWSRFLNSQLGKKGIKQIMLTHTHPDHSGNAEWLQAQTGAALWLAEAELDALRRLWRGSYLHYGAVIDFFAQWGVPEEHFENIVAMFKGFYHETTDLAATPLQLISPGQCFSWAGNDWQTVVGRGHTPSNVCFYQANQGLMITGDQILPSVYPNISVWWGSDDNPLQLYLNSIAGLRSYACNHLLPSHGLPFSDLEKRINTIVQFHRRRLTRLLKFFADGPKTAYEAVAVILPKAEKGWAVSLIMGQLFALIRYLLGKGLLLQSGDHTWRFKAKAGALEQLSLFPELSPQPLMAQIG